MADRQLTYSRAKVIVYKDWVPYRVCMRFFSVLVLALICASLAPMAYAADASCNDIELSPLSVTIHENQDNRTLLFDIENENNHPFEIDDIRNIESNPHFDMSLDEIPDEVNGNGEQTLRV